MNATRRSQTLHHNSDSRSTVVVLNFQIVLVIDTQNRIVLVKDT